MKTLEERLDHVLLTLIRSGTQNKEIIHYGFKEEGVFIKTEAYSEMFQPLELSNFEFMELLNILVEKKYITYYKIGNGSGMTVINLNTNQIEEYTKNDSFRILNNGDTESIAITLKGKFFRLQGGFQGEEKAKNRDREMSLRNEAVIRRLTFFLAVGSMGLLAIELMKFLIHYLS